MTLGEKLIQLRKQHNMTQSDLGEKLNMTAQAISKWERNQAEPDILTIKRIATLFNISIDELLNEEIEEVKEQKQVIDEDVLGFCSVCGGIVKQENFGEQTPKMLCKTCKDRIENERKNKLVESQREEQENRDYMRRKRNKALIWGAVGGLVAFAIFATLGGVAISVNAKTAIIVEWFALAVVSAFTTFSLIAVCKFENNWVEDLVEWFLTRGIRWPGVIFSLDYGGIIFLITVKLLFAILGFLIGFILAVVGFVVGSLVAPFAFPYYLVKINKQIKGDLPIDCLDTLLKDID